MKIILVGVPLFALLAGCTDRRDAQIKALAARLDQIEAQAETLTDLLGQCQRGCSSNAVRCAERDVEHSKAILDQTLLHADQSVLNKLVMEYIKVNK